MALPWNIISENVLNVAKVLDDLLNTSESKDVDWITKKEDGTIESRAVPNLAKLSTLLGKKYIGSSDTEPTSKLDGSALEAGDMYFDTKLKGMRVYNGSEWLDLSTISGGYMTVLVDSNHTASVNELVACKAGDITVTLPEANNGDLVIVADVFGDSQDHPITIVPANDDTTIAGDDKLVGDVNNFMVFLIYIDGDWKVTNSTTN